MLEKGMIVRIKSECLIEYSKRLYSWFGQVLHENATGMVIDINYNGSIAIVNWFPLGLYPMNDPRIAVPAEWVEINP